MKFSFSPELKLKLRKLKIKNPKLLNEIRKQLKLFEQNHKYPSLRVHKLKGSLSERWSISVEDDMRMLFYISGNEAVFYDLGTHDQVYRT